MLMKNSETQNNLTPNQPHAASNYLNFGVCVFALLLIFVIATSDVSFLAKFAVFVMVIVGYAVYFWLFQLPQALKPTNPVFVEEKEPTQIISEFDEEIENKLFALEEASQFFGASLKADDMFRLVSSRINEMITFKTCALFLGDIKNPNLKIIFSTGENASSLVNMEIKSSIGLAGRSFSSKTCQIERDNFLDNDLFGKEFFSNIGSAIAAPLFQNSEIFGVLQLFGGKEDIYGESSLKLLEAICERFSPLILSSIAFEKNLSNALTDSLTNLPNERAYFLVLENQIAESQRNRDERPLSVLAIDIKNFGEINRNYGHSTGDSILLFAADLVKTQLRGMDFLARSSSDEFLVVLPTASEETTLEIASRLEQVFKTSPFGVSGENKILIQLNHGCATFWKDGETAAELLKIAQIRKKQSKTPGGVKIIRFPSAK